MNQFLDGCIFLAASIASIFFYSFWKQGRDRFFLLVALSFTLIGLERLPLIFLNVSTEQAPYVYLIRLLAFALFGSAILDKNRASPRA